MRPTLRPKTLTRRLSFWLVAAGLPTSLACWIAIRN